MKHYKLTRGNSELNSTSENHLRGLLLNQLASDIFPENF